MSNHKFPLWKTWKQDCFASEAEQAWPPVCRTACLLDFPWIPGFLALHISVCLPVCMCDREQPALLRGKNEGKNKIRGTYLSRWLIWPFFSTVKQFSPPFSPSTSEKKVINWCKFTADMAGHSRWKFSELLWLLEQEKLATPRAEMHLSLWGAGGGGRSQRIIIICMLAEKCVVKCSLRRGGAADGFLAEIMSSRACACCLYQYLEPQSRGQVGWRKSSAYSNTASPKVCLGHVYRMNSLLLFLIYYSNVTSVYCCFFQNFHLGVCFVSGHSFFITGLHQSSHLSFSKTGNKHLTRQWRYTLDDSQG